MGAVRKVSVVPVIRVQRLLIFWLSALEPVAPFPKYTARLRLAGVLVPILLASFFVTAEMVVDGTTFLIGVVFFTGPVTSKLAHTINHRFPHWRKLLELRRYVLEGTRAIPD